MKSELIGVHNQAIICAQLHERSDGYAQAVGDVRRPFIAGSVAKLYIAAAALVLAREGDFDLNSRRRITLGEFSEGNYGSGRLRFTNLLIALPLRLIDAPANVPVMFRPVSNRRLLELMVSDSDNLATLVAVETVGRKEIQQVLTNWGMKDTSIYNPKIGTLNNTTANDVALFLRALSRDPLIIEENDTIKGWMPQREIKSRECESVILRYKEGRTSQGRKSFYHKVGLIESQTGEDIFVILTEGVAAERGRIPFSQIQKVRDLEKEVIEKTH